jgi:outer membrane protein TolC
MDDYYYEFKRAVAECAAARAEVRRLQTALEKIEQLGQQGGLRSKHGIATHYEIRKIVYAALKPLRYTGAA